MKKVIFKTETEKSGKTDKKSKTAPKNLTKLENKNLLIVCLLSGLKATSNIAKGKRWALGTSKVPKVPHSLHF